MILVSKRGKRPIRRKGAAAVLLSTCLLFPYLADAATAIQPDKLCPAHPAHDELCGYAEAVPGLPCAHLEADAHDESCWTLVRPSHLHTAECYAPAAEAPEQAAAPTNGSQADALFQDAVSEAADTPEEAANAEADTDRIPAKEDGSRPPENPPAASDETPADTAPEDPAENEPSRPSQEPSCGYVEGEALDLLDCPHERGEHTEDCGYIPPIEGQACTHHCAQCPDQAQPQIPAAADTRAADSVQDEAALRAALESGRSVILTADISAVSNTIRISEAVAIDLNGHTISYAGSGALFHVPENGALTVTDNQHTPTDGDYEGLTAGALKGDSADSPSLIQVDRASSANAACGILNIAGGRITNPYGRAVSSDGGQIQVSGGYIVSNGSRSPQTHGGAFFLENNSSLTITDGVFYRNTGKQGGVIRANQSTVAISGGIFHQNTAVWNGGILYLGNDDTSSATIRNAVITGNTAAQGGGAVCIYAGAKVTVENGLISQNQAENGGAFHLSHATAELLIKGGSITGNTAVQNGGAIHSANLGANSEGGSITINGETTIQQNTAENEGGAIYVGDAKTAKKVFISGNRVNILQNQADGTPNSIGGPPEIWKSDGTLDTSQFGLIGELSHIEGVTSPSDLRDDLHDFIQDAPAGACIALTADYTTDFPCQIDKEIQLDLNGHTITYEGREELSSEDSFLFSVTQNGKLTIRDSAWDPSQDQREPASPADPVQAAFDGQTLTYYSVDPDAVRENPAEAPLFRHTAVFSSGIRSMNHHNSTSPAKRNPTNTLILVDGGSFCLESGLLANWGGYHNIYVKNNGAVLMSGGYLAGAQTDWNGGGILADAGNNTVVMTGGVIAANHAGRSGGGIHATSSADIQISGGIITGNSAGQQQSGNGGAISQVGSGDIVVNGNAVICCNASLSQRGGGISHRGSGAIDINDNAMILCNSSQTNGGGISHSGTGDINIRGTARISYNQCKERGGGISNFLSENNQLGQLLIEGSPIISYNKAGHGGGIATKSLTLNSGTVDHNTADGVGGGIFIARGGGEAKISPTGDQQVFITYNTANDHGANPHGFAGGGIFVEHPANLAEGAGLLQSRVLVTNALITENKAQYGGGIAGCGTSEIFAFAVKGAAIFGNTATGEGALQHDSFMQQLDKKAQDLYCDSSTGEVSRRMLGNHFADWTGIRNKDLQNIVTPEDWGDNITLRFQAPFYLTSSVSPADQAAERNLAKVFISHNVSRSGGGGIGGNGHIQLGVNRALIIEKMVEHLSDSTAFRFEIALFQDRDCQIPLNGTYLYTVLRKNNAAETKQFTGNRLSLELSDGDRGTIFGLPETADPIFYQVTEIIEAPYEDSDFTTNITGTDGILISNSDRTAEGVIGTNDAEMLKFTNTYVPPTASLTVQKKWAGTDTGKRPDSIQVQLLKDGQPDGEPVTLSADTTPAWFYKWEDLPLSDKSGTLHEYTVQETPVPDGYQCADIPSITLREDAENQLSITNTYTAALPDSGSLSLRKRVTGAQTSQRFTFRFALTNEDGSPLAGDYPYTGSHSGMIQNGGTIQLAHGEQVTITGLPIGTKFIINETVRGNFIASVRTNGISGCKSGIITEAEAEYLVEYTNAPPDPPGGSTHPPHEEEKPKPQEEEKPKPQEDPKNPPEDPKTPPTPPENPPVEPETPPATPENPVPETPPEQPTDLTVLPDPNAPGSPARVTMIGDDGVPLTYVKMWDPENEEWVYLPEDEVPLALMDGTPQTGDGARPALWGALCTTSLAAGWLLLPRNRKKRRIRRKRRSQNRS